MTIEQFAEQHKVRVTRDECGDPIIEGTRGHLYIDGDSVCVMALDSRLEGFNNEQVRSLGGSHWIGSIWRDARNRGHRDFWVKGIPEENWKLALRLLKVRKVRELTEEQKAQAVANLKPFPRVVKT